MFRRLRRTACVHLPDEQALSLEELVCKRQALAASKPGNDSCPLKVFTHCPWAFSDTYP